MRKKLIPSGIEAIGYVPWGTHLSQLYETKEDLLNILALYFKAGLEGNEFCLWITSNSVKESEVLEALGKQVPNVRKYLESGQLSIGDYKDFYLQDGKVKPENLINKWVELHDSIIGKGFHGLRVCGDESWIETKLWKSFIEYENRLNKIVNSYKIVALCTYCLKNCSASDVIDIIQSHQFMLVKKNDEWVIVEGTGLKDAKEKLNRVNRLYKVLSKINHAVIRNHNSRELYEEACRIAVEDGLFKAAWIGLVNKEVEEFEPAAQWGLNKDETELLSEHLNSCELYKNGMISNMINTSGYMMLNDIQDKIKHVEFRKGIIRHNINSCAIFPLVVGAEVIGIMAFYSQECSSMAKEEIDLLRSLCEDISFAIKAIEKEEELRQSEDRYKKILTLSPAAIIVHSRFIINYANLASAKLLGVDKPEDLIGRSLLDFIHKDYHEIVKGRKKLLGQEGVPLPFVEEKYIKSDGSIIDVEATAAYFPYKDKNAMVSVIRDITEIKKIEQIKKASEENKRLLGEAREYDKLKTEFFANISHELRTPINVILSAVQLINLYGTDDKIKKYIDTLQQNCYRLLRLVSNIIDITKMDAGFFELQLKNHNIVSVVEDITFSVSEYIENKGISLLFDTEVEEKVIACDHDKIDRIMLNLLSNAVKFTNSGGTILVNIYDRNDNILISVKDDGIGIPEDKKSLIFERFHQVDKSLTRSHEGSGIGLSIVKSLVELHGGTIRVQSEYGKGTEFIIELPVNIVDEYEDVNTNSIQGENFEKISVEFSDIYK
ncbi:MEDS domain-containing protein [Clostridium swellfunianum]|uniref:MASE3 domain-containing sensor histidine kinase n=1 Tax=Clostridium swellfunianum TaxID=1367462 RepID=UPI00202EC196|nr:MEDS domain-containing protein [Clostridium swellfunianum]MCM0649201.1 MEDS domain-containing protein [Clostridium swellfunianum]